MWYVMVGDTETGPLTRVDVGVEAASGAINGETLVWREGMADWTPGAKVPELAQLFLNPPKSPRRPPAPPRPKQEEKGMGVSDFDTAHFRLADLQTQKELQGDSGLKRDLEFDTAHFRLAELGQSAPKLTRGGDRPAVPKRIAPKRADTPLELDLPQKKTKSTIKQASTAAVKPSEPPPAVKSVRATAAPKPAAPVKPPQAAKVEEPFDPNRTSVDFRTLGALVHDQQKAQELFEKQVVPDAPEVEPERDPHAAELSNWAADQLAQDEKSRPKEDLAAKLKAKALSKPPPPLPMAHEPKPPSTWLYVAIAGGIVAAVAFVAFLLLD